MYSQNRRRNLEFSIIVVPASSVFPTENYIYLRCYVCNIGFWYIRTVVAIAIVSNIIVAFAIAITVMITCDYVDIILSIH